MCVRTGRFVTAFCFYGQSTISVISKKKRSNKATKNYYSRWLNVSHKY